MKDIAADIIGEKTSSALRPEEFWAIDDVSFDLRRGDCVGLVGRNGAGKTTLLKLLSGLIKPDKGRIEVFGRVGALIALGAGFNPLLTGRENIYVNGSILGLSKREIDSKLDDIIDFAEIEKFIDAPLRSYSSGMNVRLGFAVATAVKPDLLLLDEVLAVGDAAFRAKCYNRIKEIQQKCATVFVSHNEAELRRVCKEAMLIDGTLKMQGDVDAVFDRYNLNSNARTANFALNGFQLEPACAEGPIPVSFRSPVRLRMRVTSPTEVVGAEIRVRIEDLTGESVAEWQSCNHGIRYSLLRGMNILDILIPNVSLRSGRYYATVILTTGDALEYTAIINRAFELFVSGARGVASKCQL